MSFYCCITGKKYFPNWEKSFSQLGTNVLRTLLIVMMMVMGVNVWGQIYSDGVYLIKNSNNYYLWPSIVTGDGKQFLTTLLTTSASSEQGCGTGFDKSYSHWVVKNIDETKFQIIHPRLGKYIVIRDKAFGDRDVWLDNEPSNPVQTYFTLNGESAPYYLSPTDCFKTESGCNLSSRTLNSAQGGDKDGLGSGSNGKSTSNQRQGLLQFYIGDPLWSFIEEKLDAPTISDVDIVTSNVTVSDNNGLPSGYNVRYTFSSDGTAPADPVATSDVMPADGLTITEEGTLKVVIERYGVVLTNVATKIVVPVCITPIIAYSNGEATITTTTDGASIYYTTDGTPPSSNSTLYEGAFAVSDGATIKAIAVKSGLDDSEVASLSIVLTPTISLEGTPCTYDGTEKEPTVSSVKVGDTTIDPSEYTVSYSNNINAGSSATVTISDNEGGEYYVVGSTTFTINPLSIGSGTTPITGINIDVSMSGSNYVVTVKHGETTLTEGTDYTWTGGPEVTVTGMGNYTGSAKGAYIPVTPGYYVLHQSGKGYLKVSGINVNLSNDTNFRSGNLFDDNGNCIWYITSEGYLQNEYFYLNVGNNKKLYLSVNPVTRWRSEDVTGENTYGKKHLKINDGTQDLYLCNDGSSIALQASPSAYYSACPVDVEEVENSWTGTPAADNLTVQSPQLVTYLRAYFTQKIKYNFRNDAGAEVKSTDGKHERRVYATIAYKEGGNKGTDWDIDEAGILYNKKASGDVEFTATYNILPADPVVLAAHPTPATKDIKYKVTKKPLTFTENMDYLLYSISGGDSYRYPYDDGVPNGNPVKPDGKGGTDNTSVLRDPDTDKNLQISWKITADDKGFYTFQNSSTNKYLYYDESAHSSSDFGVLRLGETPTGNSAKFRLYKTSDTNYSTCYYIIPYSKLFAVYKSDGLANGLDVALNVKDYTNVEHKVISLFKPNDNSKWCIYKYEAEYRVKTDFTFSGPASTDAIGNVTFTSIDGWYGKCIKESPKEGGGQQGLVVSGSYNTDKINYIWTVIDLGDYINHTDWIARDGGYGQTLTGNKTFTFSVSSLPTSTASGIIQLQLRGGEENQNSATNPYKWSGKKTLGFNILGDGTVEFTEISSLSEITSSGGLYRLKADVPFTAPGVTTFSGILDCNNKTINGLTEPLFTTLTNGVVRNLNLSGVAINQAGAVGAVACTANGSSRIYNVGILDGSVGSTSTSTANSSEGCCGGLVGLLDGYARVINCYSYANITGGNRVGGIVGYNNYETKSNNPRTMVMNCMFYGNITGGTNKAPIYNGKIISNVEDTGVGNYNYFLADASFTNGIDTYHCALMAEKRFLQRFEFYRHLLNGHRELAGWWATGTFSKNEMAKWVMEPSQIGSDTPYPILKDQGKYPSVVNIDAENATTQSERNKGGKLGELTVNIQMGDGAVYQRPSEATITTSQLTLNITDKDPDHFNFNYYKVQLPYYNDVGTKNYTGNRVVTGWKIVSITGGSAGSFTTGDDVTYNESGEIATMPYNFADRNCINKDLYSVSGRVFNQGAYWDVPEGVTAITIEPYWAKCVYLADANADVVYNTNMGTAYPVPNVGGGKIYNNGNSYSIAGENQVVYTTMSNAIASSGTALFQGVDANSHSVYDYAVVLVGNYHNYNSIESSNSKPYTVTSIDLDGDNEPDYSYILRFDQRKGVHPVKYDFLNLIGLGMAQKSTGSTGSYNFGIMQPMSWFEVTNTALFRVTQLEYEHKDRAAKPLILHGGVIEQWVSGQSGGNGQRTTYIHVGSNVWFKEFHLGCHQDATLVTKHPPVSVTGGDYNEFYLTGLYSAANNCDDNAECYINGGRFGKVAGTGIEGIGDATNHTNGNIVWQIQNADIEEFYGGGINAAKPMQGNITTVITGSHVKRFCGGPKFGDMNQGKTVITTATDCTFGSFFGAGYGGNSYNRAAPGNFTGSANYSWNDWIAGTVHGSINNGNYPNNVAYNGYKQDYISAFGGVSTRFDYQFLPQSDNLNNVGRLFIDFVNFSLATTRNVTSTLTGCTITGNFYGGGSLGKVDGNVTSTLTDCTVHGSVFGGGYDATLPTVQVMSKDGFTTPPSYNTNTGVFFPAAEPYNSSEEYSWEHSETVNSTETAIKTTETEHILYTTADLTTLGQVTGNVTLDILGNTLIEGLAVDYEGNPTGGDRGGVFGGGDASAVLGNTTVTINATALQEEATYNVYNVYGGGNSAPVGGNSTVTLQGNTQVLNNVFGGGNEGIVEGSAEVNIE